MAGKKKKTNICTDKTKLRQLLEFCAEKFEKIRRYQITDSAISLAIQQLPKNTRIEDVLIKATLINSLYGTAIFDIIKISQHICKFHNSSFTQNDLADYKILKPVIDSLIGFLNLENAFKYKKIDQALWLYAKYLYKRSELDENIVAAIDIKYL